MDQYNSSFMTDNNKLNKYKQQDVSIQVQKQREDIILSKFKKKEKWAIDDESIQCFLCRKLFNILYRRKHHCRKCGQVFCGKCSNYFLCQLVDEFQKKVDKERRLCKNCFKKCQEYMTSKIEQQQIQSDDQKEEEEDDEQEEENDEEQSQNQEEEEIDEEQGNQQQNDIKLQKQSLLEKRYSFNEKLRNLIGYGVISQKNVARKCMKTEFMPKEDIKANNNLINRKEQKIYIQQQQQQQQQQQYYIKCIVVSVAIDVFSNFDGNIIPDLKEIISKQKQHMQKIIDGFQLLNPQIIFCKENVNQDILSWFEGQKISVVQKIKSQEIFKIAEIAKCKIVDDIEIFFPNKQQKNQDFSKSQYLGNLNSIYFRSYQSQNINTFMFLESFQSQYVSLLVFGENVNILKIIKKKLKNILKLAKNLYMECQIIYQNDELIKQNKKNKKLYIETLENDVVDFGNFNTFIDEKIGIQEFVQSAEKPYRYTKYYINIQTVYSQQAQDKKNLINMYKIKTQIFMKQRLVNYHQDALIMNLSKQFFQKKEIQHYVNKTNILQYKQKKKYQYIQKKQIFIYTNLILYIYIQIYLYFFDITIYLQKCNFYANVIKKLVRLVNYVKDQCIIIPKYS
ncbi:hypothetical protein IMG5_196300 [Ichthyophthirius multifiliis]|uniref:FYVE-type domain-containing protein n=1 Tax=Ichthyophthirius multifiliis TaxID=5932 RepID=G0R545_ICHMU|nr:hypothetical protein IMG5_196300 [Ichthyophthirius multifiliis]EGR27447.1 hypothetical protein IMG5_196300 [Ichthyophthirius multifiliis]|eukprot:XP_004024357.1 hypothetical protein IMG5_196300 [Ichthyophthirius multifiliis]